MDEQVKQLAETLMKQGLAVSMYEAIEKAESILNIKSQNNNSQETEQKTPEQDVDNEPVPSLGAELNADKPLNEVFKESNATLEQTKEETSQVQEEVKEKTPDLFDEEKKIDLSKIFGYKR